SAYRNDEAQGEPPAHPDAPRDPGSDGSPADLRAQDPRAPGVPRSLLRVRGERLGAAARLVAHQRPRRGDPQDVRRARGAPTARAREPRGGRSGAHAQRADRSARTGPRRGATGSRGGTSRPQSPSGGPDASRPGADRAARHPGARPAAGGSAGTRAAARSAERRTGRSWTAASPPGRAARAGATAGTAGTPRAPVQDSSARAECVRGTRGVSMQQGERLLGTILERHGVASGEALASLLEQRGERAKPLLEPVVES